MKPYNELPLASALNSETLFDYIDSYEADVNRANVGITAISRAFFLIVPGWVENMMKLRNMIVGVFGLKTSCKPNNHYELIESFQAREGEQQHPRGVVLR